MRFASRERNWAPKRVGKGREDAAHAVTSGFRDMAVLVDYYQLAS